MRIGAVFVAITGHRNAFNVTGAVLAAHDILRQRGRRKTAQRVQYLQLGVAHCIGGNRGRRLHRDDAQQLQQMVLQHVAQRAGGIVITHPGAHAQIFGDGDLHVGNPFAPPQRFEQHIAEAQRQQILYRFLAQVMIDAKYLRLREHAADFGVDLFGAGQVATERLFHYHAGILVN